MWLKYISMLMSLKNCVTLFSNTPLELPAEAAATYTKSITDTSSHVTVFLPIM